MQTTTAQNKNTIEILRNLSIFTRFDNRSRRRFGADGLEKIRIAVDKKFRRYKTTAFTMKNEFENAKIIIGILKELEYDPNCKASRYNCTGIDWCAFVRFSSIGGIYACAPDEPSNCIHIDKEDKYFNIYRKIVERKKREFETKQTN